MHTYGAVLHDATRDGMLVPFFDEYQVPGRFTDVFQELWPRIKRKLAGIYHLDKKEWTTLPSESVNGVPYCAV